MANPNIIQFSLPEADRQKLKSLSVEGESSLNLTAKRLLNSILDGVDLEIPDNVAKVLGDRLSALESRLSALEGDKQETAIMIQKRHSPAPVIPEITYSHEQAATEWQRTTATVKRWASKPEKWPQGWLFDADKQFWVRTA